MTSTAKLQKILSGIDPNIKVHRDFHRGKGESYIVHEVITERDEDYADDEPQSQVDTVRIHYFTKSENNSTKIKRAIRRVLRSNGFSIAFTEPLREADTGYYHIVIQATAIGEADCDTESEE